MSAGVCPASRRACRAIRRPSGTGSSGFSPRGLPGCRINHTPGQTSALTPAVLAAVRQELARGDRTWTARQITAWLAEHHGVRRSVDQVRRVLKRAGLSYKRTYRSVKHKQDAVQVAVRRADLETLEKGD